MMFTAIAYRWGWTNDHHYPVAASTDIRQILEQARQACEDRAGKYGVVVYEWPIDGSCRLHTYYPSMYGEKRPFENPRTEMFLSLGHRLHEIVMSGVEMVAIGDTGVGIPEERDVPDWAARLVHEKERGCFFTIETRQLMAERKEQGLPARKVPDSEGRWRRATQKADELMAEIPGRRARMLALRAKMLAEQQAKTLDGIR